MLNESKQTFNGAYTDTTTGTYTNPDALRYPGYINDPIEYCPYCGKKLPTPTNDIHYCPFCGKEIPRTYTGNIYQIHWHTPYPKYEVTCKNSAPVEEHTHC